MHSRAGKRQLLQLPVGLAMNTLSYSEVSAPPTNQHPGSHQSDLEFRTAHLNALIASGSSPAIDFLERITQPNSPAKVETPFKHRESKTKATHPQELVSPRRPSPAQMPTTGTEKYESPRIADIRKRYGLPPRQRRSLTVRRSTIGRALEREREGSYRQNNLDSELLLKSSQRYHAMLETSDGSLSQISSKRQNRQTSRRNQQPDSELLAVREQTKLVTQRWQFNPQNHRIYYDQDRNVSDIGKSMKNERNNSLRTPERTQKLSLPTEALNTALQQVLGNLGIPVIAKVTVIEKDQPGSPKVREIEQSSHKRKFLEAPSRIVNKLPIQAMTPSTKSPQKRYPSPIKAIDSNSRCRNEVSDENQYMNGSFDKTKPIHACDTGQKQLRQQLKAINVQPNTRLFRSPAKTPASSLQTSKVQSEVASTNTDHRALKELRRVLQSTMSEEEHFYIRPAPETFRQQPDRRAAADLFGEGGFDSPAPGPHTQRGSVWKDLARAAPGARPIRYLPRH